MRRAMLLFFCLIAWPAEARQVALQLVLALDVSSSVDDAEFILQRDGLAQAFRSAEVIEAVKRNKGGVAIAILQWSSHDDQRIVLPWTFIGDEIDCLTLSVRIERLQRGSIWGLTALGSAVETAQRMLDTSGYESERQVIDVSGDGSANAGVSLLAARAAAIAAGTTINGLAIYNEELPLAAYYARDLIGGPGAFVMDAADYVDFARAIRLKLQREINGPRLASDRHGSRRPQAAHQQPEGDGHVHQVPADPMQEGGPV